jgi:3-hydroxybutyryl-CoA dehydrogenase
MEHTMIPGEIAAGIVGLGLMGSSIATCLLIAGHPVVGLEPLEDGRDAGEKRIHDHLNVAWEKGLIPEKPAFYLQNLLITSDYDQLHGVHLIIENVKEDIVIKQAVFAKIDAVVSGTTLITSNTSAIPISDLQEFVSNPSRFFGLHWMQPAHTTRFLEVICGKKSDQALANYLYDLGALWEKETVLVKKDIRGFIGNRLMYAMYREAMYLVEEEYASVEDVDRACRNVAGYFLPMVGVFRWMDLTGIGAYRTVMKDLFPILSNAQAPGELINKIVDEGGNGVFNGKGFYNYTDAESKLWQDAYNRFTYEIRVLALKYPHDVVKKQVEKEDN